MKTFNENTKLYSFDAWSGAKDTKNEIIEAGKAEDFDQLIEELYPDGLSETTLNDILWFETEFLSENLNINL